MAKKLSLQILDNVLNSLKEEEAQLSDFMTVLNDWVEAYLIHEFSKEELIIGIKTILNSASNFKGEGEGDKGGEEENSNKKL